MSDDTWAIRRDDYGHAVSVTHGGRAVLNLLAGTERNESGGGAERVLAALNESARLQSRITALRQHARTACRAAHDKKAQLKHVKQAQYAAKKRAVELEHNLSDFACYVLAYMENPTPANLGLVSMAVARYTDTKVADVPDPCRGLQARVAELDAELQDIQDHQLGVQKIAYELARVRADALQAIVDRLPRTKDKVPWTPNMNLWVIRDGEIVSCGVIQKHEIEHGYHPVSVRDAAGEEWDTYICECYSTRKAAAETARSKT